MFIVIFINKNKTLAEVLFLFKKLLLFLLSNIIETLKNKKLCINKYNIIHFFYYFFKNINLINFCLIIYFFVIN